ncbi:MAG TPA: hypothetical protein VIU87_18015 [Mycobacterium sp.]
MDDSIDPREAALQLLPAPYSLALRLRDAGVSDEVICEYLEVEPEGLAALLEVAEAKLAAARKEG